MDYYTPQPNRRHNPVDSICRKLQTIQWRGDREPNSPFQIPKLSSSSYDSPQIGLRHNLEAILKKQAVHRDEGERGKEKVKEKGMGLQSSAASQRSSLGQSVPLATPPTPTNVTYTITSTLGERRGADGSDLRQIKTWQSYCSTPTGQSKDSPYFTFTRGPRSVQPESEKPSRSPPLSRTFTPSNSTLSYNLNFCSVDTTNLTECELPYPALVVKRLSMGNSVASESRKENMAEISLICEENLLDTIFHACDTQRRGKVYVSHIVDYLRHTTSRSTEDSGLEELCNMLDPEHKDVSIDLDTYHAVMREWIDDCRNTGEEPTDDITQDSVKLRDSLSAKRSMLLNMTSGSLEAFGGEASRAEFETSELVYCVADLQMSNQKLQEEVRKLKQVVEGMEDSNQKLAEENEDLRNQARLNQQLAQKEKMLKEEVEEMKATLSFTEEGRARASAHSKHVERENQSLIGKIASLQEENFKVTMETDELQRRIAELCDINANLQVPFFKLSFRNLYCIYHGWFLCHWLQLLRADKNKLENQMQMMYPDLAGGGLSLSVAYRLNQSTSGSLQTELALAQSPLEVIDHLSTTMSFASPLDETLDREVLLMLQGPSPEHMALEFRSLLNKLKRDFRGETDSVLSTVRGLLDNFTQQEGNKDTGLQTVQAELDARRADWALSLDQLAQYTDSLEKELIKMASNMRRSRTEILHLSVRVQEQENKKRQLCEELEQLKTPQDSREASCQTPAPEEEVRERKKEPTVCLFMPPHIYVQLRPPTHQLFLPGTDQLNSSRATTLSSSSSPQSGSSFTHAHQSGSGMGSMTSDPSQSGEKAAKKDSGKNKRELVRPALLLLHPPLTVRCNIPHNKGFRQLQLLCRADVIYSAEFQRLSLGFKCDMFTLEKRLRLEERSRDLAEENVRREVSSCQGLLQALIPLCDDDNQSMEIIQRLQKNLDILIQSMTRVSSRSEMLGAIHQESRIGKAVEVMIQHVENLRRMYTKEHAELLELRETLMQNERSFGSHTERGCYLFSVSIQLSSPDYHVVLTFHYLPLLSSSPSPSFSPTSTDPGMAQSLSHSLTSSRAAAAAAVARGSRGLWLWLAMVVLLAGLLALLASLVMQPAVDAAPVGTGDSWMTIQQLLWPYAGLRHNGQPPV
uniref:Lymphoid-restricted membrane protein n=1 Tax=Echeneis naucrates TaxID=173247 RepID=A0A665TMG6_ECHNA